MKIFHTFFLLFTFALLLSGCDSSTVSTSKDEAEAVLAGEWESEATWYDNGDALKIRFALTDFGSGETEGAGISVNGTVTAFFNSKTPPIGMFKAPLNGEYESDQLSLEVFEGGDSQTIKRFDVDSFDCIIIREGNMECDLGEIEGEQISLMFTRGNLNNTSPSVEGSWQLFGDPVGDEAPVTMEIKQEDTSLSISAVGGEGEEFSLNGTYYAPLLEIANASNAPVNGVDLNCLVENKDQMNCNIIDEFSISEDVQISRTQ